MSFYCLNILLIKNDLNNFVHKNLPNLEKIQIRLHKLDFIGLERNSIQFVFIYRDWLNHKVG